MKACILLVEDDPLSRRLVYDILTHRGHQVIEAASVDEARAQLDSAKPQLVLLDVQIPGGGGELVLQDIRGRQSMQGVPVVAVTAQASRQDEQRLKQLGFDAYFSKPISTRTFASQVEALLKVE